MDKQAQSGTPFVERTDMPAPRNDRVLLVPSVAGAVGNLLEWYDFGLYGLFAPIFAQLFFPDQDRIASLIGAYSGFAIGFAARPLGAAVLGHLGDRAGRRAVMIYSIVLMGFATTATAVLPTHHMIGIAAPMLLLFTRALQGFSVGGEYTGSVTYLIETAPNKRRGLAGSIANIGATAGMLLASGVATATLLLANSAEVRTWAWRIPFLLGGVIATTGYLLRHRMRDTGFTPTASVLRDRRQSRRAASSSPCAGGPRSSTPMYRRSPRAIRSAKRACASARRSRSSRKARLPIASMCAWARSSRSACRRPSTGASASLCPTRNIRPTSTIRFRARFRPRRNCSPDRSKFRSLPRRRGGRSGRTGNRNAGLGLAQPTLEIGCCSSARVSPTSSTGRKCGDPGNGDRNTPVAASASTVEVIVGDAAIPVRVPTAPILGHADADVGRGAGRAATELLDVSAAPYPVAVQVDGARSRDPAILSRWDRNAMALAEEGRSSHRGIEQPWREQNLDAISLGFAWIAALLSENRNGCAAGAAAAYQNARARMRERGVPSAIDRLSLRFRLAPFDEDVLLLALSSQLHGRPHRVTPQVARDVYGIAGDDARQGSGSAWRRGAAAAISIDGGARAPPLPRSPLLIDERVGRYLMGEDLADPRISGMVMRRTVAPAPRRHFAEIERLAGRCDASPRPVAMIVGPKNSGRRAAATVLASGFGLKLSELSPRLLEASPDLLPVLAREAALGGFALLVDLEQAEGKRLLEERL